MRGFTLFEILIALFLLILTSTLIFASFSDFLLRSDIDQVFEEAIGLVNKARGKTIASEGGYSYGIRFEQSKVVLFRAPTYSAGDPNNIEYIIPGNLRLSSAIQGGGSEILFQSITGEVNATGTVTITNTYASSRQKTFTIIKTGLIE